MKIILLFCLISYSLLQINNFARSSTFCKSDTLLPYIGADVEIERLNFTQFDTTGWKFKKITKKFGPEYYKRNIGRFETVYMYPDFKRYVFQSHYANEERGKILFADLKEIFGKDYVSRTPFDVTWQSFKYKIRYIWNERELKIITWLSN